MSKRVTVTNQSEYLQAQALDDACTPDVIARIREVGRELGFEWTEDGGLRIPECLPAERVAEARARINAIIAGTRN